jgi:hypothetical protein
MWLAGLAALPIAVAVVRHLDAPDVPDKGLSEIVRLP